MHSCTLLPTLLYFYSHNFTTSQLFSAQIPSKLFNASREPHARMVKLVRFYIDDYGNQGLTFGYVLRLHLGVIPWFKSGTVLLLPRLAEAELSLYYHVHRQIKICGGVLVLSSHRGAASLLT